MPDGYEEKLIRKLQQGTTYQELSDSGFSRSTIKRRIKSLRNDGYRISEHQVNGNGKKEFILKEDPEKLNEVLTTSDKRQATEENKERYNKAINLIENLYDKFDDFESKPVDVDYEKEEGALYISDIHMGSVVQNDGEQIYDSEIAGEKIKQLHKNSRKLTDYIQEVKDMDKMNFVFFGDIIENDIVYENQKYEIDKTPLEQVKEGVKVFAPFIKDYADKFKQVDIHAVPGNHGRMNADSHEESNWDNIFYHMLNLSLKNESNVSFDIEEGKWNEFYIKNKKIGITHGKNMHYQAGTSAGEKKFLRQIHQRDLDEIHLGHYHSRKSDEIHGSMIYWNGAVKPTGKFEKNLGVDAVPSQTFITYSPDRGTTGVHYIDCRDEENDKDEQL